MLFRFGLWFCIALFCVPFVACEDEQAKPATQVDAAPATTRFPLTVGDQKIQVRFAIEFEERQKGLMHRKEMPVGEGMLFIFERPQKMSFWMHNTPLPLSIGYFSPDGILRENYWMYPNDRTPVESRRDDIQLALEMNQGWFRNNGIRAGAKLNMDEVREAMRARGYDPEEFGL